MEKEPKEKVKTPKKRLDYSAMELKHYNELLEMNNKVQRELKPLKQYLEKIGLLKKEERKTKK